MSETVTDATPPAPAAADTCAQCARQLAPNDRVAADDRVFCRSCYESLKADLRQGLEAMTTNINYVNGTLGAILGGAVGALVWWGFTVVTHLGLGLVAIAIGFLTGHGAVRFTGGKRSGGLQAISVVVAVIAFLIASYLVSMSFMNQPLAHQGDARRIGFPPGNLDQFARVVSLNFGLMDFVFLAIVVYEAWKIPRPIPIPAELRA